MDDSLDIGQADAMIPDVVREHHDVRTFRAQVLAAGLAHPYHPREPEFFDPGFQRHSDRLAGAVRAAGFVRFAPVDAHEEDFLVRDAALLHLVYFLK